MSIRSEKLAQIPSNSGCYLYKDAAGTVIYIGKAKDLRKRVLSYFHKNHSDWKTDQLVSEIADVEFMVTNNELEALLLEAKLIRDQQPKYNMELKGGIRYAYIRVTKEKFPRLETARLVSAEDKLYGPFAQGSARKNLIHLANELFKLRVSKRKPVAVGEHYRIITSVPPWNRLVTEAEYAQDIDNAELLLKGKIKDLAKRLEIEMENYSKRQQYELARHRRNQLEALASLEDRQSVSLRKAYDQDVLSFIRLPNKTVVQVFNITKGVVSSRKQFAFPFFSLDEFISQFYYANEIPQEVIVPEAPTDQGLLEQYLTELAGRKVVVTIPLRGQKRELLDLVQKNILATLQRGDAALLELQNALQLPKLPRVIECFDISNLGATDIVASMVYFRDGVADKNEYRRFKIYHQRGQSDVDAMREVIERRYRRLLAEQTALPDLVLVDGGKPQLGAALEVFRKLGFKLPLAALAKKQEELFRPGRSMPLRLDRRSDALKLVQRIRDEAHRFAITYHRLLRSKKIG